MSKEYQEGCEFDVNEDRFYAHSGWHYMMVTKDSGGLVEFKVCPTSDGVYTSAYVDLTEEAIRELVKYLDNY